MTIGRIPSVDGGIQPTIVDAKGDLIVATAADTPARLAVGTNGQYLKADSTATTGLAWATLPASGKILQVVQDEDTSNFTTTSTSFVDTGLSVTITPSSTSSKVMVYVSIRYIMIRNSGTGTSNYGYFKLLRGSTQLQDIIIGIGGFSSSTDKRFYDSLAICYLDSPATTSATTYKVQAAIQSGDSTNVDYYSSSTNRQNIVVMEVGA